jgi:signal transduction histidine kinase
VKNVITSFEDLAKATDAKIELELSQTSVSGEWDRLRIEQAVTNLLSNAIKYAGGKPIKVGVRSKNGTAQVIVADQGAGVAEEDQVRIFQRYERAANPSVSGFGIGLYLTQQIAEAHGGATFVLEIPLS